MGHTNTNSLKRMFGPKFERSKDPIMTPPKMDIINLVRSFVYLEPKVTETSCEKNQARCYVVQVV
jgi:hypothetical protein